MKILYGVQGTGNGHITRARAMQKAFAKTSFSVDYLFSGRNQQDYFDMQCFGDAQYAKGLTFVVKNGKVQFIQTALKSGLYNFFKEVRSYDASGYDLIITDFEPITARLAKKHNIPVLGLGHQYVFNYEVPQAQGDLIAHFVMKHFAPADDFLAVHWHHFEQKVLPPILEDHDNIQVKTIDNKVVVYLAFENQYKVYQCLSSIKGYQFIIYTPNPIKSNQSHIQFKYPSRKGFIEDLYSCDAVIANAGFELSSEVIKLGKRLLVKPLKNQIEQFSNAMALKSLGYGNVMNRLCQSEIHNFLLQSKHVKVNYPNVADVVVDWIKSGMPVRDDKWYKSVWQNVEVKRAS